MGAEDPGAPVRIRAARAHDAAALLELKQRLDQETSFMMFEPGERDSSVQDLARELAQRVRTENSVVLLAELADELVGYVELTGGSFRRSRATAYLVIGSPPTWSAAASAPDRRAECLLVNGQFIDELTMAVILPDPLPPSRSETPRQPGRP